MLLYSYPRWVKKYADKDEPVGLNAITELRYNRDVVREIRASGVESAPEFRHVSYPALRRYGNAKGPLADST